MASFLERLEGLASKILSSPSSVPNLLNVPAAMCRPAHAFGASITKDASYFSVRVNELFLKEGRSLWDTYDPMLVAVTELLYAGKKTSIPYVISSELLKQNGSQAPHSLLFNDILVAGPHPFHGGNVALSLVLYKVKRNNFAKDTLKFVEGLSSAVGIPADIGLLGKVGNTLIDGMETLIGLNDTVALFGSRLEIDTSDISGFSSSCWLLTPTNDLPLDNLVVEKGRLSLKNAGADGQKFDSQDYVLYSLVGHARRGDESSLPFHALRQQALDAVLSGEEGWKRAKALLLTLYQQMLTSPDLTTNEAKALFEDYKKELLEARDVFQKTTALSLSEECFSPEVTRLNDATSLLDLN